MSSRKYRLNHFAYRLSHSAATRSRLGVDVHISHKQIYQLSTPSESSIPPSRLLTSIMSSPIVRAIRQSDFEAWKPLFRAYIDFYKSSLPDEQYQNTFDRLVDPSKDLYGLVMATSEGDGGELVAIAHYFPHQTPWSERPVMHLNGEIRSRVWYDMRADVLDLFVDPNVRGKGYGKQMIKAVEAKAREADCTRLQWDTQHGNPARKLYDQVGQCDFVKYMIKF